MLLKITYINEKKIIGYAMLIYTHMTTRNHTSRNTLIKFNGFLFLTVMPLLVNSSKNKANNRNIPVHGIL